MTDKKTALITGGSGFFGSHLARRLLAGGFKVRILDLREVEEPDLRGSVEFIQGDVRDPKAVEVAIHGAHWVFSNAAALPISRAGKEFHEVNVAGTRNVLESALKNRTEKVVHISTSAVYLGQPVSMPIDESTPLCPLGAYGRSKFEAEQVCQEYKGKGLLLNVLRPRTLVGTGRLGIFQILFDWIKDGKYIYVIGGGDNLFQLLSSEDLAEACWLAASTSAAGSEDFCLGTDRFLTVREDLEALIRHAGTQSSIRSIPAPLAKFVLGALDALRLSPLVDWHYKTPDKPFYFDISKAKKLLGWSPKQSNQEMLQEAYDWYLAHYNEYEKRYGVTHRSSVRQGLLRLLRAFS